MEGGALKKYSLLSLVLILLGISGCGTLVGRGDADRSYRHGYYYLGTKYDWRILSLKGSGAAYDYTPELCYVTLICPIVVLLSIPVDAAIDTVLLHGDKQNKESFERGLAAYVKDKYCNAEGGPDRVTLEAYGQDPDSCPTVDSDNKRMTRAN